MNRILILACALGLTACKGPRISKYDEFEKVKVDRMVGNEVKLHLLSKTIVCLNAMREARWPEPWTNITVKYTTNYVVNSVTNMTVTSSANRQLMSNTNLTRAVANAGAGETAAAGETNQVVVVPNVPQDTSSGGATISTASSESIASGPNQSVVSRSYQTVTMLNNQETVNASSQSFTGGTNQMITVETNWVITSVTNPVITAVTNTTVQSPLQPEYRYYVYLEIAPADYALAPGESLILLVDGKRYGLTSAQPQSGWSARRGYQVTFYRVEPEVLEDIANAREVRLRIKGANGAMERQLSGASRQAFREFLVRNFGEESAVQKRAEGTLLAPKS